MHPLHHSSLTLRPEFASISLLLSTQEAPSTPLVGDMLSVVSPLATTSLSDATRCLEELHAHVGSARNTPTTRLNNRRNKPDAAKTRNGHRRPESDPLEWSQHAIFDTELKESAMHVFRPLAGYGIALHYRVVVRHDDDEKTMIPKYAALLLGSGKGVGHASGGNKDLVTGIIVCVGVSGWFGGTRWLGERLKEVIRLMHTMATRGDGQSRVTLEAVLATVILTDDEERKTNAIVEAESMALSAEIEAENKPVKSSSSKSKRSSKKGGQLRLDVSATYALPLAVAATSSADVARITAERLAVLSIAESDMKLRPYQEPYRTRRLKFEAEMGGTTRVRLRRRKTGEEADLEDFDCPVDTTATEPTVVPALRPPSQIRSTRSYHDDSNSNKGSVPTLVAPRGDVARVGGRRSSLQPPVRRQDLTQQQPEGFDLFSQSNRSLSSRSLREDNFGLGADAFGFKEQGVTPTNIGGDGPGFDPFSPSDASPRGSIMGSPTNSFFKTPSPAVVGPQGSGGSQRPDLSGSASQFASDAFDEFSSSDWASPNSPDRNLMTRLKTPMGTASQEAPRMSVNVALNEDLTCSYRQSKLSSCSVEGVVQVQVSLSMKDAVPFFLYVRDPSNHIKLVQENRRYADDITQAAVGHDEVGADYKFTVSVPISEKYFPIMRYKCSTDLRPVPIRVQTRVRLHDNVCRVALQISSNPTNDDDLSDLTIMMGVPPEVQGNTLITSPAGGVWNDSKQSVVWCVAELGGGEKFQLGAQFKVDEEAMAIAGVDKPKFPVLVRCQCMYSQLSEVELEVSDIPEIFPADVSMKLARRFRLSHRERS